MTGDLLYVSPVLPAPTGNGLAMRAHTVLRALARRFRVFPLVVPLWSTDASSTPIELDGISVTPRIAEPGSRERSGWVARAAAAYAGRHFDVVHVFRMSMLPFAEPYLSATDGALPARHLDLDDIESITRRRLVGLYRLRGRNDEAAAEAAEASRHEVLEAEVLERFDRVYVCSEHDRGLLLPRARAQLVVLPNGVRIPEPSPAPPGGRPFTFLFVGTLSYIANEDAVLYFCEQVLPLLQQSAGRPFRLVVVGAAPSEQLRRRLQPLPSVELTGDVPDVAPWYGRADAVVVPVRGGGGTRIKLLEAFAYRRPVVSTTIGAEGIDALDEEHLLHADTPAAFAERCLRLMSDAAQRERLAAKAFALLAHAYTVERVAERLSASFATTAPATAHPEFPPAAAPRDPR